MNSASAIETEGAQRRSRVRYGVLMFVCTLSMVTYLDRACISVSARKIIEDLGLTGMGDLRGAFTAFALAFALFEVPTGWLGDVFGPRKVLIRIVLWWSAFTALTGMVGMSLGGMVLGGVGTLVVVRFLFGMGEAGAYPNITRTLHNWFPVQERGFAQGSVWMSGRIMGGLTPLIWTVLVAGVTSWGLPSLITWRQSFWLFGLIGVLWCVAFALWFRERPEQKPQVNAAEMAWIRSGAAETQAAHPRVPWLKLLASGNLWFLCMMYGCLAYGWYFNITYLPGFLEEQYGVAPTSALGAIYKGGPLGLGAVGCLLGGFLTDWFTRRTGNRRWGRRLFGMAGLAIASGCLLICPHMHSAFGVALVISLSAFFADLNMGAAWAVTQDIGRRYAGTVAGFMNMVGNLVGGMGASWISGTILKQFLDKHAAALGVAAAQLSNAEKAAGQMPGYHLNFYLFAAAFFIGFLCWMGIDATRPVLAEDDGKR